jgi:hypothetical protein
MPKSRVRPPCVPEAILSPSGIVSTILLDERYTPYTKQAVRVENICGSFKEYISTDGLERVSKGEGSQKEIYHLHGNVIINRGKAGFMGVRSFHGIERLSQTLRASSTDNMVHMAVLTSRLGKRVQVSANGILESNLRKYSQHIRVEGRMYESTNTVRFSIFDFSLFQCPEEIRPDNNDWLVTGKGLIIIRMSWRTIGWTDAVERACICLCNRVTEWIDSCC